MASRLFVLLVAVLAMVSGPSCANAFRGGGLGLPTFSPGIVVPPISAVSPALPNVPPVFPPVALGKLETRNMLAFCVKVNLDSPATKGEEPTITLRPGERGDVPIMTIDPTTKSLYRVTVFLDPPMKGACSGPFKVYATNGPLSARAFAAGGYRADLPGFCTGGDGKELQALIVEGFPDPQGTDTNIDTQTDCAKQIDSGVVP